MKVTLCEVGPRDGLQNDALTLSPVVRAELINRLAGCGLRRIEAVSFVRPERVPQMDAAEEVVALVSRSSEVSYAGLVLNTRGYERLANTNLDQVRVAVSCTESFSQRNANSSVADAVESARRTARAARADGRSVSITLMVAFGCPFEGDVPSNAVLALAESCLDLEPDELILADTIGVGSPTQTRRLLQLLSNVGVTLGVHLHDTRNTAIANALAAIESGATVLDASVGGTGGCPFAPGASGNVATEDLVYVLAREGIDTGVNLDLLISTAQWLSGLLGHPLPGRLHQVGRRGTPSSDSTSAGGPTANNFAKT